MNLKAKAIMIAKAFSVWWGIFLIIGCCVGFSLKILSGFLFVSGDMPDFDVIFFVPMLIAGSFLLALISNLISILIYSTPVRKMRRRLNRIYDADGYSKEYIDTLLANCKGNLKNKNYIELAFIHDNMGSHTAAVNILRQIDIVSVTDIAHSTGNFYTPAYFYAVSMLIYLNSGDNELAAQAYENGKLYIDTLEKDEFIVYAKALYLLYSGIRSEDGDDDEFLRKLPSAHLIKIQNHGANNIILVIKAYCMFYMGLVEKSEQFAAAAAHSKLSPVAEKHLKNLYAKFKENPVLEETPEPKPAVEQIL